MAVKITIFFYDYKNMSKISIKQDVKKINYIGNKIVIDVRE